MDKPMKRFSPQNILMEVNSQHPPTDFIWQRLSIFVDHFDINEFSVQTLKDVVSIFGYNPNNVFFYTWNPQEDLEFGLIRLLREEDISDFEKNNKKLLQCCSICLCWERWIYCYFLLLQLIEECNRKKYLMVYFGIGWRESKQKCGRNIIVCVGYYGVKINKRKMEKEIVLERETVTKLYVEKWR